MRKHDNASQPFLAPFNELTDLQVLHAKSSLMPTPEVNTPYRAFEIDGDHLVTNSHRLGYQLLQLSH